jgi:hypothetical protein
MCRCRTSLIRGTKKGHGKISWPNPIGKHIQVLQQNPGQRSRARGWIAQQLLTDAVDKVADERRMGHGRRLCAFYAPDWELRFACVRTLA